MQQNITLRKSPPSLESLSEGQIVFAKERQQGVRMYTRQGGQIWSVPFSNNTGLKVLNKVIVKGDSSFNNKLTADTLEARNLSYNKFIDYRPFPHNFSENLGTALRYIPWEGPTDNTDIDDARRSYLAPFKMTLHRILFRPETISDSGADITFGLVKQIDGSTDRKVVATGTYTNTISSNTYNILNKSDFLINAPFDDLSIEIGEKVGIYIQPKADPAGSIDWFITSVWKTEVDLS